VTIPKELVGADAHDERVRYNTTMQDVNSRLKHAIISAKRRSHYYNVRYDPNTISELRAILERQGYRCAYCPHRIIHDFYLDHIISFSDGGAHMLSNIQFTCPWCNYSKWTNDRPSRTRYFSPSLLLDEVIHESKIGDSSADWN
jgi:5-methylcytosine-specific restriction endonuclease McrA